MINLWEDNTPGYNPELSEEIPSINPYLLDIGKPHGAVIVCAGGGYGGRADYEADPPAMWLNRIGLSAFVLNYRVAPYKHPYPMMDAQRAIRYIRYNAAKLNIDPDKIGILGFSAGGHLAATAGTLFDNGNPNSSDPIDRVSSRPNAMILCYPVISMGEYRNDGTRWNLIGGKPAEELKNLLSGEKQISKDTPPAFLWHTANDNIVAVENSLMFAGALSKFNINYELHVFSEGPHGLAMAQNDPCACMWTVLCENWLKKIGFINI